MPTIIDQFKLTNKVALVTGAARGIGQICAGALAEAGADVVITDLPGSDLETTASKIRECGRRVMIHEADVTKSSEVDVMIKQAETEMGGIDIVFNNAGICINAPAENMTDEEWLQVVNVDLNAVFYVARAVGRAMIARGQGGRIINTASMSAHIVNRPQNQCAYNAAKAGVVQLTKSLACEWAPHQINVNSISPGYTSTAMTMKVSEMHEEWISETPAQRMATPEELAPSVIFLASPGASFVTGHDLVIDGGFTCW